ncbi:AraC family transcriptional regulator [Aquimarina brevivitae]|uniref:AraC family transcriptional regulator n=1 Tax=Aquimarina brevivitae TaxID=323412 RepID=UPI001A930D41|nr:AraC family transcriptional regulator [Aquimarina brevivitae]
MKYRLLLILGMLSLAYGYNQRSLPPTINQDLKDFILREKKTDSVEQFLSTALKSGNLQSESLYQLYLQRGQLEENNRIQYISYFNLSKIASSKKDLETAVNYGNKLVAISKNFNNAHYEISALNLLGNTYYNHRDYDTSLPYYLEAVELAKATNFRDFELQLLANINNIRTRVGKVETALHSYQQIISKLSTKDYKNISNYSGTYLSNTLGIGVCYYLLGNYDQAIETYTFGINKAKTLNSLRHIPIFNTNIGEALIAKEKYPEALALLASTKERLLKNTPNSVNPLVYTINLHLANLHYKTEQYTKALQYLTENFTQLKKVQDQIQVDKLMEMYDLAERSAEKLGNKEKQLAYSKAYRSIVDSIYTDNLNTKDKLYQNDIVTLQKENENLTSSKQKIALFLLLAVVLVGSFAFIQYYRNKRNKRRYLQLQQTLEEKETVPEIPSKKDSITDDKASTLLGKLKALEKTEFYLQQDCNLYNTAKLMDTNTSYLSKIINDHLQKSFNEYITTLRITYCIKRLKLDRKFRSYTIKGIANEIGYKSVNTFTAAFKKQTGLSHSFFINQISTKEEVVNA